MTKQADLLTSSSPVESNWSRPDDRFLPIRACDLVQALSADAGRFGLTAHEVESFAAALERVLDRETGAFERRLADVYARFNPDRDTLAPTDSPELTAADYEILSSQLAFVLDKANYEELDDVQIAQAVMRARTRSLSVRVDPNRVEFLRLWVRGRGEVTKPKRCRWRPWKWGIEEVPVFRRLVVVARLKNDPHVILKLFKDIPEAEAEALLPHAEVTMSLWDRFKLLSTGAGTVGITVSKLLKIAIGFAALWNLMWILLIGLGTLGVRSALGYRNARRNREWQRTRHLYFQNLGNNASALQLLVALVKQEELKEALLAYLFAQAPQLAEATESKATLCERIEQYLEQRFEVEVDFDIQDAEQKLAKLGLTTATEPTEVVPLADAMEILHQLGDGAGGRILELS